MTGKTYIITVNNSDVSMEFQYDLNGRLCAFKLDGSATDQQYNWLLGKLPIHESSIALYKQYRKQFKIEEKPTDLSFNRFWNEYGYKVGSKPKTQQYWKKLSDSEKIKALLYINRYKQHCKQNNIAICYPQKYLNQKYYEID